MCKYSFPALLLVVLYIFTFSTSAQDTCGKMNAESCRLLNNSTEAMSAVKSLVFDIDSNFIFEDIDMPGLSNATISFNLDGSYIIGKDSASIFANPMERISSRLRAINSVLEVEFSVPSFGFMYPTFSMELRLLDGVGYLNADELFALGNPNTEHGWFAFDLIKALPELLDDETATSLASTLSSPTIAAEDNFLMDYTTRKPNNRDNGIPMAVFETRFFISEMYEGATRAEIEEELMGTLTAQYGAFYSRENLEEAAQAYAGLVENMEFKWTRTIDLVDHYLQRFEFSFELKPGEDIELAPESDPLGISLFLGGSFVFELDMHLSDFNHAPLIAAPEDVTTITLDDLLPLLAPGSPI